MRKNGFTLIELLAVIVILAIIALIATPIILGIISDAKKESQERSAELYLSGVELAVVRKNLTEEFNPSECTISNGVVKCIVNGVEKELEVEVDGEAPTSGTIVFTNNKATSGTELKFDGFTANINSAGKLEIGESSSSDSEFVVGKLSSVCRPVDEQHFATNPTDPGYKYECDVDPNKAGYDYTFYVLNSTSEEVNLIMDSNINESGVAIKEGVANKGFGWINQEDYETLSGKSWMGDTWGSDANTYGPVTAIKTLSNITKNWTNVNLIKVNKFESCDDDGICVDNDMAMLDEYKNGVYARLPYYSEIEEYSADKNNAYLYDNMWLVGCRLYGEMVSCDTEGATAIGINDKNINHVDNVRDYWTLSAYYYGHHYALSVDFQGYFDSDDYPELSGPGIRPVINLDI